MLAIDMPILLMAYVMYLRGQLQAHRLGRTRQYTNVYCASPRPCEGVSATASLLLTAQFRVTCTPELHVVPTAVAS